MLLEKMKKLECCGNVQLQPPFGCFGLKEVEGFLKIQRKISSICGKECGY